LPHIEKHSQFSPSTPHEGAFASRHDLMIELCELFIVIMDVGQSLIVGNFLTNHVGMCYYNMWQTFFRLGSFRKIYGLQNYIGIW